LVTFLFGGILEGSSYKGGHRKEDNSRKRQRHDSSSDEEVTRSKHQSSRCESDRRSRDSRTDKDAKGFTIKALRGIRGFRRRVNLPNGVVAEDQVAVMLIFFHGRASLFQKTTNCKLVAANVTAVKTDHIMKPANGEGISWIYNTEYTYVLSW
ncbi:hypothetical protein ANCCAN_11261, partial [Ancylostoma caninum]